MALVDGIIEKSIKILKSRNLEDVREFFKGRDVSVDAVFGEFEVFNAEYKFGVFLPIFLTYGVPIMLGVRKWKKPT